MEDFKTMLENYLDENEINNKLNEDLNEINIEKKSNKKSSNYFIKTITIHDFVNNYLGTKHSCENLKHQGLKSFKNPYVIGIPNDFASKNPDHIIRNEILVVLDSYGNPGTYINPDLLKKLETMEECKYLLSLIYKIKLHSFEKASKLSYIHSLILNKANELEKSYIDSCDLLKILEKENILYRIRRCTKQAKETYHEYLEQMLNIDNLLEIEFNILNSDVFKNYKLK